MRGSGAIAAPGASRVGVRTGQPAACSLQRPFMSRAPAVGVPSHGCCCRVPPRELHGRCHSSGPTLAAACAGGAFIPMTDLSGATQRGMHARMRRHRALTVGSPVRWRSGTAPPPVVAAATGNGDSSPAGPQPTTVDLLSMLTGTENEAKDEPRTGSGGDDGGGDGKAATYVSAPMLPLAGAQSSPYLAIALRFPAAATLQQKNDGKVWRRCGRARGGVVWPVWGGEVWVERAWVDTAWTCAGVGAI
eukprot:352097-Chlamydomonas_euryale.AAC.1